jgi:hypothetical protein
MNKGLEIYLDRIIKDIKRYLKLNERSEDEEKFTPVYELKICKLAQKMLIIMKKKVDLRYLKACLDTEYGLKEYNKHQREENELTEEEFNFLKNPKL